MTMLRETPPALDDFETQVPGRLLALEALLVTIVRRTGSRQLLAEAETALSIVEGHTQSDTTDADGRALAVFSVARGILDKMALDLPH